MSGEPASHFILYVADQERSFTFYSAVLAAKPRIHVPGMTEFDLPGGGVLGLMPEEGIRTLLGSVLAGTSAASGIPRAELYLVSSEPGEYHSRALAAGARALSPPLRRSWGHVVAYSLDPDGYVLAFASREFQSNKSS